MTFALQDTKLWGHINGSARRTLELKENLFNDDDKKEHIYQWQEKIQDFNLNILKTAANILRMYSNIIQKEFLAVKNSTEQNPKDL